MKCLFLGYNRSETKLVSFLKKKGYSVKQTKKNISQEASNYDLIISFGYRKVIKKNVLNSLKRPIINLHMSYLPYNRGSHPNFWSFYKNTPKGVSIHEINELLDGGPIIFKKKINFKIVKNKRFTFKQAYKKSFIELEKLFIDNFEKIRMKKYKTKKNLVNSGSIHRVKDLPNEIRHFDVNIYSFLKKKRKSIK